MVRLSITVASYRPEKITKFMRSLIWLADYIPREDVQLIAVPHDHLTVRKCGELGFDTISQFRSISETEIVPFVELRGAEFKLADGEYIMSMDDDHTAHLGSSLYLLQCLEYMDMNPDVGVFLTHGQWGSAPYNDLIHRVHKTGMILMSRGMIYRNDPALLPTAEEKQLLGGMEETLYAYKMIASGYSVARRYLNPTEQEPTKHFDETDDVSYQTETLNKHIIGYIRRRWDDKNWVYGSDFPRALVEEHRANRGQRGFKMETALERR